MDNETIVPGDDVTPPTTPTSEDTDVKKISKTIPYERFVEVNEKAKNTAKENEELKLQLQLKEDEFKKQLNAKENEFLSTIESKDTEIQKTVEKLSIFEQKVEKIKQSNVSKLESYKEMLWEQDYTDMIDLLWIDTTDPEIDKVDKFVNKIKSSSWVSWGKHPNNTKSTNDELQELYAKAEKMRSTNWFVDKEIMSRIRELSQ